MVNTNMDNNNRLIVDRKYFRLSAAAEVLKCTPDDLVHLGANGRVELLAPVLFEGLYEWVLGYNSGFPEVTKPVQYYLRSSDFVNLQAEDLLKIHAVGWAAPTHVYSSSLAQFVDAKIQSSSKSAMPNNRQFSDNDDDKRTIESRDLDGNLIFSCEVDLLELSKWYIDADNLPVVDETDAERGEVQEGNKIAFDIVAIEKAQEQAIQAFNTMTDEQRLQLQIDEEAIKVAHLKKWESEEPGRIVIASRLRQKSRLERYRRTIELRKQSYNRLWKLNASMPVNSTKTTIDHLFISDNEFKRLFALSFSTNVGNLTSNNVDEKNKKKIHRTAEKYSGEREKVLTAALYYKFNFPEQCKDATKLAGMVEINANVLWGDEPPMNLQSMITLLQKTIKIKEADKKHLLNKSDVAESE
jgi:hypothetical protein